MKMSGKIFTSIAAKGLGLAFATTFLLSACNDDTVEQTEPYATVFMYNASSAAGDVDIYQNSSQLGTDAFAYGTFGYVNVSPGTHIFDFKADGSSSTLASDVFSYEEYTYYSLFLYDASTTSTAVMQLEDTFEELTSSSSQTWVRFINLSSDAGTVDVVAGESSTVMFDNLTFSNNTDYLGVDVGTYDLKIVSADDNTVELITEEDLAIQANYFYTIILEGYVETEEEGRALQVKVHSIRYQ